ncbi:hypothetical protein [Alcanivorax quisquiliarum]|uniref:Type IV secretion system protein VirB3 n=1 Tax=Alcanivorax quisquiliarum TaxID=2933565 RepID=A0ABT0E9A5_9GAMM|nr:hypothetical protein [Alcanivorax quisquiliarum]MCK0538337.1 hypothetical protein [Alcanivorax quisquiliarum]
MKKNIIYGETLSEDMVRALAFPLAASVILFLYFWSVTQVTFLLQACGGILVARALKADEWLGVKRNLARQRLAIASSKTRLGGTAKQDR